MFSFTPIVLCLKESLRSVDNLTFPLCIRCLLSLDALIICSQNSQPNAFGARIVVPFRLNLPAWEDGLTSYDDSDVAFSLAHGLTINYC